MKRVFFCFAALYCAIQFAGCQTNFDQEFENNLIRLSAEHTSGRFHNGDDINFYYHCEFATEVDFAIKAEDNTTILQHDEATLKPGEGFLTFNINTNGYEGKAFVYITYNTIKRVGKRKSKDIGTSIWELTITNEGSWYYENEAVNELVKKCKDFDSDTLASGLVDEWEHDSYLKYNDDWSKIIEPYRVIGYDYIEGLAYEKYNFNADGTGWHSVNPAEPNMETMTYDFNWSYDAESGKLTLSGDYNNVWSVTGYNDCYVVLDQISREGWNYRTILKRKAE